MSRRTLAREVSCQGVALHAGTPVHARLMPADSGTGILFRRDDRGGADILARYDRVSETRLGTGLAEHGVTVGVVEHLMAAIFGAGIDDLTIALDGPEPPILDGDALSWLVLLEAGGVFHSPGTRSAIRVARPVLVQNGNTSAALFPAEALLFDVRIDFSTAVIGVQELIWSFSQRGFRDEIAPARTFGFVQELDALRKAGLGNGASLTNTLAIDSDGLRNPELRRFPDEFVRHKILDAIGDLALAGAPIIGRFEGRCSGHAMNNALLRALFSDAGNYEVVAGLDPGEETMA